MLTVKQVAVRLNCSLSLVYKLIDSEQIASIEIGRLKRITPEAVEAFILKNSKVVKEPLIIKRKLPVITLPKKRYLK